MNENMEIALKNINTPPSQKNPRQMTPPACYPDIFSIACSEMVAMTENKYPFKCLQNWNLEKGAALRKQKYEVKFDSLSSQPLFSIVEFAARTARQGLSLP